MATWKGNSCNRNCLSLVGRDYVTAAQTGKGSLHFWTWHKVCKDLSCIHVPMRSALPHKSILRAVFCDAMHKQTASVA